MERFEDLFGGDEVAKMPGDQATQPLRLLRAGLEFYSLFDLRSRGRRSPVFQQP